MIYLSVLFTLLISNFLTLGFHSYSILYGLIYAISLWAMKYSSDQKNFLISFDQVEAERKKGMTLLAGEAIENKIEEDSQEDRFLEYFSPERKIKRRLFSGVLIITFFVLFHHLSSVGLSAASIVPMIYCLFIVNSYYIGHLLYPLMMSLLMVLYIGPAQLSYLYLPYIFFFGLSLYLIGEKRIEVKENDFSKVLKMMGLFLLFFLAFQNIPEWKSEESNLKQKNVQKELQQVALSLEADIQQSSGSEGDFSFEINELQEIQGQLGQGQLSPQELMSILGRLKGIDKNIGSIDAKIRLSLDQEKLTKMSEKLVQQASYAQLKDRESNELKNEFLKKIEDIEAQKNDPKITLSAGDLEKLEAQGANYLDQIEKLKNPGVMKSEEKEEVEKYLDSFKDQNLPEELKESLDNIHKKMDQDKLMANDFLEMKEDLEKLDLRKREQAAQTALSKELNKLEKKMRNENESHNFHLKKLIISGVAVLVIMFLFKLLSGRSIKKIKDEATDLDELKEEISKLRRLKLSPRDEVIHYYNLFHNCLQKIHYSDHEAPPSCIINDDMPLFHQDMIVSTEIITNTFAQCFYGNKEIGQAHLKQFRKAFRKVLKVYDLE